MGRFVFGFAGIFAADEKWPVANGAWRASIILIHVVSIHDKAPRIPVPPCRLYLLPGDGKALAMAQFLQNRLNFLSVRALWIKLKVFLEAGNSLSYFTELEVGISL